MEPFTIAGWVAGVVGAALTAYFAYLLNARKQLQAERMQLLPAYEGRIATLERDHAKCMENHAQTERQLGSMQENLKNLQAEETLKAQMNRMEMYLHNRFHDLLGAFSVVSNRTAETNMILGKITSGEYSVKATPSKEPDGGVHPH